MARGRPVRTNRAREKFIAKLAESCNVSAAAREAGIGRSTAYEWKESDPAFAEAWVQAEQEAADKLEQVAWDRATGDDKSDRMLEILLKAHRPEKFVDRIKAEHSGSVPVTFNFIRQDEAPRGD